MILDENFSGMALVHPPEIHLSRIFFYLDIRDTLLLHDYSSGETTLAGNSKRFDPIIELVSNGEDVFDRRDEIVPEVGSISLAMNISVQWEFLKRRSAAAIRIRPTSLSS